MQTQSLSHAHAGVMKEGGLRHRVGRSAGHEDLVVECEARFQPGGGAGVDDAADGVALQDPRRAPESHRLRERARNGSARTSGWRLAACRANPNACTRAPPE